MSLTRKALNHKLDVSLNPGFRDARDLVILKTNLKIFQDFFSKNITASEAAEQLTSSSDTTQDFLWSKAQQIWEFIIFSAGCTAPVGDERDEGIHRMLIELLREIKKIDIRKDDQQVKIDNMVFWQDLPGLKHSIGDAHDFNDPPASESRQAIKRQNYCNFTAFIALMLLFEIEPYYEQYAIRTLSSTLETSPWTDPSSTATHKELSEEVAVMTGPGIEFNKADFIEWQHEHSVGRLEGWIPATYQ